MAKTPIRRSFEYGLAFLIVLFYTNRDRLRTVLRPSRARLFGTLALAMIIPIRIFLWMPVTLLYWAVHNLSDPTSANVLFFVSVVFGCYLSASFIVTGIASWAQRVAYFSLIFLATYSALTLWPNLGIPVF